MSKLNKYRIFLKDAKGKTRIMELNSGSVEKAMVYIANSRQEVSQALGAPIMPHTAILLEIQGGRYGR